MASSTLGRRSTWTEGDKAIAAKYPANFHPEIIALREKNIKSKKSRELLKDDIGVLERRKFYQVEIIVRCEIKWSRINRIHNGYLPEYYFCDIFCRVQQVN